MAIEIDIFNPPPPPVEVVIEKEEKPTPFSYINNVNTKKDGKLTDLSGYIPWFVNKGLSFQKSNILYANEMNMNSELTNEQQYDYFFHKIPRGNPWGKWSKFKMSQEEENVMKYFECSYPKATQIVKVLTKKQLKEIEKILNDLEG